MPSLSGQSQAGGSLGIKVIRAKPTLVTRIVDAIQALLRSK